jgi:hypothetical protein
MCNIDGEPFAGLSVTSSSEAPDPSGSIRRWIDTSGEKLQLREWSSYTRTWVAAASTYVRVELEGIASGLREGDAVDFSSVMPQTSGEEMGADVRSVQELLNGSHVIQKKISDDAIVLIGIVAPTPNATTGASNLIMIPLERGTGNTESPYVRGSRTVPDLDFVVECGNRLWGCRYDQAGEINEIYASALGDFFNWHKFEGLSTDSWTASRGRPAPFTGAAVLGGCPLFFREDSLEKVIPSSSGAHQIRTYDMEGVAAGSQDSLVVIDERLYYKSRHGICVYTGTMPQRISEAFGGVEYANASGARHGRKYCISMDRTGEAVDPGRMVTAGSHRTAENSEALGERVAAVYDLDTGIWHLEDEAWEGKAATWGDRLYYVRLGRIYAMDGGAATGVDWWAETAPQEIGLPEHKWISYLRIRLALEPGAAVRALVAYDGGVWEPKGAVAGNLLRTQELIIWPRRSDSFRLRLEGTGGAQIQSISYRVERSEGGH